MPRLKPGEYVKGDVIVSPRLGAREMGFVLHGICEGVSSESGQTIQTYRWVSVVPNKKGVILTLDGIDP